MENETSGISRPMPDSTQTNTPEHLEQPSTRTSTTSPSLVPFSPVTSRERQPKRVHSEALASSHRESPPKRARTLDSPTPASSSIPPRPQPRPLPSKLPRPVLSRSKPISVSKASRFQARPFTLPSPRGTDRLLFSNTAPAKKGAVKGDKVERAPTPEKVDINTTKCGEKSTELDTHNSDFGEQNPTTTLLQSPTDGIRSPCSALLNPSRPLAFSWQPRSAQLLTIDLCGHGHGSCAGAFQIQCADTLHVTALLGRLDRACHPHHP
ncbi:MAG: hypothetical protein J3Q66DRAFT_166904 [Benniella sp.]|nr:MAG: hypothetical protein J3Q66DRAFT_166904 [Benniella sp.]